MLLLWSRVRRARVMLCVLLACVLACDAVVAWSGANAYTLVLLDTLDTDAALRAAFYDGAAGTVLELDVDTYTTTLLPTSPQPATTAAVVAATSADANNDADGDESDDGGASHAMAWPPLRAVLSNEWVVLERPLSWQQQQQQQQRVQHDTSDADASSTALLHCRLPLPHNLAALQRRRARYVRAHHAHYARQLAAWWRGVALRRASRCLYGDAEGALTLTPRYYVLCPLEGVWRVRHYTLWRALSHGANNKNDSSGSRGRTGDDDDDGSDAAPLHDALPAAADADTPAHIRAAVLRFLAAMHRSRAAHAATLDDARYAHAFERIGVYAGAADNDDDGATTTMTRMTSTHDDEGDNDDEDDDAVEEVRRSQPYWSTTERAWQVYYPTRRPCNDSRYADTWSTTVTLRCPGGTRSSSSSATSSLRQQRRRQRRRPRRRRSPLSSLADEDVYEEQEESMYWSITEVRQRCRFVVEMTTTAVCAWERALDRVYVNAVPCVALT